MDFTIPDSDLIAPTIRLENTTTSHEWLQYGAYELGCYNNFDCIATALAYPKLLELLDTAKNRAYYERWFATVVPVARRIQERGFGHLDRDRLAKYRTELTAQLKEIDDKILAKVSLFGEMEAEAKRWRDEDEAADRSLATGKAKAAAETKYKAAVRKARAAKSRKAARSYAAKARLLWQTVNDPPAAELTRAASREKRYQSRLKKVAAARKTFMGSRGTKGKLATWLFGEMRFKPAPKAHKRPARSTAKAALMFIYTHLRKMDEPHKWILEDLFHRARLNTIRTRYLHFPTGRDNRVYPRIRLYSAETFRWAYSDPPLHQWPAEIRHLIVPRPGYVFVAADYSQLEARILAYQAREARDIQAFEDRSRDVHAETAQVVFELTDAQWAAMDPVRKKKHRNFAKKKRYEIGYGASEMGAAAQELFCPCPRCVDKVPQILAMSPEQNRRIAKKWAVTYATTMKWRDNLFRTAVAKGRVWVSPWGYTRRFAAPASEMMRPLFNCPCQSGAAEIINRAAIKLDAEGWPIVGQYHDELILEVPIEQQQAAAAALRRHMEAPVPELGGAIFPVEVHSGSDWGELK